MKTRNPYALEAKQKPQQVIPDKKKGSVRKRLTVNDLFRNPQGWMN